MQYIYRGWAWLGIIQVGAVIFTLAFLFAVRAQKAPFRLVLIAWLCLALTLVIFFVFTYPVNRGTQNWSVLPLSWEAERVQWEYSHAVNALLELTAYILLVAAVLKLRWR